ncbi:hypothetical protein MFLO_05225 [Listeria floridensis FSL S10-1187]|uniref:Putative aromatic acid exporter C-terminal domain-containing protein n=1 Tax=Listeria floridensis FSL S10-1187 TaxID=1265817 RepID=A0ABN0RGN8_9LIST|nr:hypothetical protein MFLO_05225 [Listeria floridensis FSL S10-1187]
MNEMLLMVVGAGIAILLNLYMPRLDLGIKDDQHKIEQLMRQILFAMAQGLRGESPYLDHDRRFDELKTALKNLEQKAGQNLDNSLLKSSPYYLQYTDMRLVQYRVLTQMKRHLIEFEGTNEQSLELSKLVEKTALTLAEGNPAELLVQEITAMVRAFRKSDLPSSREEFENRAVLFQFMNDLRYFLEIKRDFYQEYGELSVS